MSAVIGNTLYLMGGCGVNHHPSQAAFSIPLDSFLCDNHIFEWYYLPPTPLVCSSPVGVHDEYLLAVGGKKRLYGKWH